MTGYAVQNAIEGYVLRQVKRQCQILVANLPRSSDKLRRTHLVIARTVPAQDQLIAVRGQRRTRTTRGGESARVRQAADQECACSIGKEVDLRDAELVVA